MENRIIAPVGTIDENPQAYRVVANGGELSDLREQASLRRDEWERIDDALLKAKRREFTGWADLRERNLGDTDYDIGTLISTIERSDTGGGAEITMSGEFIPEQKQMDIDELSFPVPFVQSGFNLPSRMLRASRNRGQPLNTDMVTREMKNVARRMEEMLFLGVEDFSYRGATIDGYTTEANRNTVTGSDWGTTSNVIPDINSAKNLLLQDSFTGPYVLYVSDTQYGEMQAPFTDAPQSSPLSVIKDRHDRIEKVEPIPELTDEAVLVQLTDDVVDAPIAEETQAINWESGSGRTSNFIIAGVLVNRVKSDVEGQSGVCHITGI